MAPLFVLRPLGCCGAAVAAAAEEEEEEGVGPRVMENGFGAIAVMRDAFRRGSAVETVGGEEGSEEENEEEDSEEKEENEEEDEEQESSCRVANIAVTKRN